MKPKKRILTMVLAVTTILSLCACGGKSSEKSLKDQGLEVVALMEEMVRSEAYVQYNTSSPALLEIAANARIFARNSSCAGVV